MSFARPNDSINTIHKNNILFGVFLLEDVIVGKVIA